MLAAQDADAGRVVAQQLLGPRDTGRPLLYAKHMAKHWVGVDRRLLRCARHVLLVRCAGVDGVVLWWQRPAQVAEAPWRSCNRH